MNFSYKTEDELNLYEILKHCPKCMRLYTPMYGYVTLEELSQPCCSKYPILVKTSSGVVIGFNIKGRVNDNPDCSCCLFPSINEQDWHYWMKFAEENRRFDPHTFKPFDKILARTEYGNWICSTFSYLCDTFSGLNVVTSEYQYRYAVPYNGQLPPPKVGGLYPNKTQGVKFRYRSVDRDSYIVSP